MTDATRILHAIDQGDSRAADELLPLMYDELRKLAAHRLANEAPGQTLQATALGHESWMRPPKGEETARFEFQPHESRIEHVAFTSGVERFLSAATLPDGRQALQFWDASSTRSPANSSSAGSGRASGTRSASWPFAFSGATMPIPARSSRARATFSSAPGRGATAPPSPTSPLRRPASSDTRKAFPTASPA
jgi:hypothetical protein